MIKRTIYFGNPCILTKRQNQLHVEFIKNESENKSIPIEDLGLLVIDNYQIKLTTALIQSLINANTAVLFCDQKRLPAGLMIPMSQHHAFTEKIHYQIRASLPLKKNLWMQTIISKIKNQANHLKSKGIKCEQMDYWTGRVRSGDPDNMESRAAVYYWDKLFSESGTFTRKRFGEAPNNMLNYGYAILRATIARSLVASGLLPSLGIFHHNKYNPYCLADDIMEPFRPYVDRIVLEIFQNINGNNEELTPDIKRSLLSITCIDINIEGNSSPLMVGVQRTTASLMKCYEGKSKKILYPEFQVS